MDILAINGGAKVKETPYGTVMRYKDNELKYLEEALDQNTLFYGSGKQVKAACEMMKEYTGKPFVVPCSSGSAAVHLGLIAAGVGPGDEVIVTPNTDQGSVLGIIEEGAVPVFCDCDWNLQASVEKIAEKITERTKCVEVIHIAGYAAPVDKIVELCSAKGIPVIEDCAQAWGTKLNGKRVGTFGVAGCFSINDYKHISAGDGGFVVLEDEELYRRVSNYSDKHYDRLFGGALRQMHHGINYRMGELQGAVARAQLEKVDQITERHHQLGLMLRDKLEGLEGASLLSPVEGSYSSEWWTLVILDEDMASKRLEILDALRAEGVTMVNSYEKYDLIQTSLFKERIVRPWLEDERKMYPFVQPDGRSYEYSVEQTPVHGQMLKRAIMFTIKNGYTDEDISETAEAIKKVINHYNKK